MEHAISNHASRIVKLTQDTPKKELLGTIEPEDLQEFD
jgi:hypothetical protein